MKRLPAIPALGFFITGLIVGLVLMNFVKKTAEKQHLDFLIMLHDRYRQDSKRSSIVSDTVLHRIFRLMNHDSTIVYKGKLSKDPIKVLLWESYHCIAENLNVIDGYDRQVYVQDSAFLKRYFRFE